MKFNIRFFLSWIISAVLMFILFYLWHGLFLNDLKRIQFPLSWFISFAALTYLILGAGIYLLFESRPMKHFRNFIVRGVLCGILAGFSLFVMATIVNISLTKHLSVQHLAIDCAWQITEQIIGAMVVVILKIAIQEPQVENA
jgi:hypothetical protein